MTVSYLRQLRRGYRGREGKGASQASPPPPICPAHGRFFQALLKIKKKKAKLNIFLAWKRDKLFEMFSVEFLCVCVRLHACVCVYENFTLMSINIQTFDLDWHSN